MYGTLRRTRRFSGLLLLIFVHLNSNAQIITKVAGGGSGSDGGPATAAGIYDPNSIVFDNLGNMYFSQVLGHKVRKIDTFGIISTIAGTGTAGYFGDGGPATNARLNQPAGLAFDTVGNLFIADVDNYVVRKINAVTGFITTICGNGTPGFAGDGGLATSAILNGPVDLKFDSHGNLFIACLGSIRKINTSGIISTVAGLGFTYGDNGDGGLATNANIQPCNIWIDVIGNIYMTDLQHVVIRKINAATGIINRIAGDSSLYLYNGDGIPATNAHIDPEGLAFDNYGQMYFGDRINNRVRMIDTFGIIHTIAGTGTPGSIGDGGPAVAAELYWPENVTFDRCNNLYVSQVSQPRIRKITFDTSCHSLHTPLYTSSTHQKSIVSIYPNPVNEELNIENVLPNTMYKLLNLVGVLQQCGNLKQGNNTISLKQLPPGLYMLVLTDEEGKKIVKRIVKE